MSLIKRAQQAFFVKQAHLAFFLIRDALLSFPTLVAPILLSRAFRLEVRRFLPLSYESNGLLFFSPRPLFHSGLKPPKKVTDAASLPPCSTLPFDKVRQRLYFFSPSLPQFTS